VLIQEDRSKLAGEAGGIRYSKKTNEERIEQKIADCSSRIADFERIRRIPWYCPRQKGVTLGQGGTNALQSEENINFER